MSADPSSSTSSGPPAQVAASALRKASLRLVPLIALGYGAAFVDRANVSFAAASMNRELGFSPSMYGFGAGLFFVSYALCEIPSNLLLVRFGARRWLARILFTWGLLAMGMLFVRTPAQFYTMRFLLGMAEAGFFPGVVFYLTQWFPSQYRARTISRFYIALPLSSTVMGSLAGALLALDGRLHLRGWQWLFLVEGLPPVVLSVLFLKLLPDTPAEARWLTPAERLYLEQAGASEAGGDDAGESAPDGSASHGGRSALLDDLRLALLDRRIWLLGLFFLCILTVLYGWAFSAPAILTALTGWSTGGAGWLIAGMGLAGAAAMLLVARHSDRTGERRLHILVPCLVMAAAFLAGGSTTRAALAIPAFTLTVIAYNAAQGPVLTLPATFLRGRSSAIGYAAITAIGVPGGLIGPWWMGIAREVTGNYQRGLLTLAIPSLLAAVLVELLSRTDPGQDQTGKKIENTGAISSEGHEEIPFS